jgi:hypothetical protein
VVEPIAQPNLQIAREDRHISRTSITPARTLNGQQVCRFPYHAVCTAELSGRKDERLQRRSTICLPLRNPPDFGPGLCWSSAKGAASILAAVYLRKHPNKFWRAPLIANTIFSLQDVGQNLATCN